MQLADSGWWASNADSSNAVPWHGFTVRFRRPKVKRTDLSEDEKQLLAREDLEARHGHVLPGDSEEGPDAATKYLEIALKYNGWTSIATGSRSWQDPNL